MSELIGPTGPQGRRGPRGPQGPQGPQGPTSANSLTEYLLTQSGNINIDFNTVATIFNQNPYDTINYQSLGSGTPYNNTNVRAIAVDSLNNAYVGGDFQLMSDTSVRNIAMWNSTNSSWSFLGVSFVLNGTNGPVNAIAIDSNNNVYVGGQFNKVYGPAAGISANNIAKWDGSNWSALGLGTNGPVNAIAIDENDNVYVGGQFSSLNDATQAVKNIAVWNGTSWSVLGNVNGNGTNGPVSSIAINTNTSDVYVGGDFNVVYAGDIDTTAYNIAKWNSGAWIALEGGTNAPVKSIALDSNGIVYVGGDFNTADGIIVNKIAMWDEITSFNATWSALGGGITDGSVNSVAFSSNDLLYVGGQFTDASGIPANNIAKWDGYFWSSLGNGISSPGEQISEVLSLGIDSSDNVYIGGDFNIAGDISANDIAYLETDGQFSNDIFVTINESPLILNIASQHYQVVNVYSESGNIYKTAYGEILNQ